MPPPTFKAVPLGRMLPAGAPGPVKSSSSVPPLTAVALPYRFAPVSDCVPLVPTIVNPPLPLSTPEYTALELLLPTCRMTGLD